MDVNKRLYSKRFIFFFNSLNCLFTIIIYLYCCSFASIDKGRFILSSNNLRERRGVFSHFVFFFDDVFGECRAASFIIYIKANHFTNIEASPSLVVLPLALHLSISLCKWGMLLLLPLSTLCVLCVPVWVSSALRMLIRKCNKHYKLFAWKVITIRMSANSREVLFAFGLELSPLKGKERERGTESER